jgi:hypothetical protein
MDGVYFAENILKLVRDKIQVLGEQITEGSVPDYNAYLKLRTAYETWVSVEGHVTSLLKKYGTEDD